MVTLNDMSKVLMFPRSGPGFFRQKSKMAVKDHKKMITFEEFNIYSFVIPLFPR